MSGKSSASVSCLLSSIVILPGGNPSSFIIMYLVDYRIRAKIQPRVHRTLTLNYNQETKSTLKVELEIFKRSTKAHVAVAKHLISILQQLP